MRNAGFPSLEAAWYRNIYLSLSTKFLFYFMSKKRWLIVPLCVVLCSQGSFAQTLTRKVLGINEMFRLADENSQSIQTYKTEKEVPMRLWKLPSHNVCRTSAHRSLSVIWVTGICGTVTSRTGRTFQCLILVITLRWKHNRSFMQAVLSAAVLL